MSGLEKSLLQTLENHPEVWSVRILVVEAMLERDAPEEAAELLCAAPEPPESEEHLYKMAELGGENSLTLAREFVNRNPANAYGHDVLAGVYELTGNEEKAEQHRSVAFALGGGNVGGANNADGKTEATETPPSEEEFQTIPLPPESADAVLTPTPERKESAAGKKATAIIIAFGVHVLIALIAALVIILPETKDEPEIIAAVIGRPGKKHEMQKKNVIKQSKKSSASAAAAAPIAQLMRANAVARIALPNVTRTSTGPLGIGDADFGGGGFGTGGGGMGTGASFFGGRSTGKRFLFVIDHSGSMRPNQV